MRNVYHSDIINILLRQGQQGMRPCQLARRIYNMHSGLFAMDVNYPDIHRAISQYLWRESKRRGGPFVRVRYGVYAIKGDLAVQLDIFLDAVISDSHHTEEHKPQHKEPSTQLILEF